MRIAFGILIIIHALVHLLGFSQAFQLLEIKQLTLPISTSAGTVWLVTALLFGVTAILYFLKNNAWWPFGLLSVIFSQISIFYFWHDSRFGTFANLIILLPIMASFLSWKFDCKIEDEIISLTKKRNYGNGPEPQTSSLDMVPQIVKKWLIRSGVLNSDVETVHILQHGRLKPNPKHKWRKFSAEQFFNLARPSFVWTAEIGSGPVPALKVRDKFWKGKGNMLIKLLGAFKIADAKGEKINQSSLQRFLSEIVWFPTAALKSYIKWEAVDSTSAKACMDYQGIHGEGIFHFNEEGEFLSFETERYMEKGKESSIEKWSVEAREHGDINGVHAPTKLDVIWKLKEGDFKWMELEVDDIEYSS